MGTLAELRSPRWNPYEMRKSLVQCRVNGLYKFGLGKQDLHFKGTYDTLVDNFGKVWEFSVIHKM